MMQRFAMLSLLLLVAACAAPARTSEMVYHPTTEQSAAIPKAAKNTMVVADVTGGEQTNPMWMSKVSDKSFRDALEATLKELHMLAFNGDGPYALSADLIKLEQPLIALDITVTATVDYVVKRRSDGTEVFHEKITTPYTADLSSALIGNERMRIADEGAIKANIKEFVDHFLIKAATL